MAEVLFNIAGAVLKQLGTLTLQEIGLLWGLDDELDKLQGTVSTIQAVLLDAEKMSRSNEEVKLWLHDLKDVVHDAEDLLDDISTEAFRRQLTKEVQLFFSSSNRLAYSVKAAHKVKAIRAKLDEVAKNRKKFHLNQNVIEQAFEMNHDRDTHSCVPNVVIGREDDKKELMSLLLADHVEKVVVIPIVGLGGIGKTTLAQMIYNDETTEAQFDLKVWVCVSHIFDVKSIVEKMIECIDGGRPTGRKHGMEALRSQLIERVKGKKYMFVLDDIWNEDREKWVRLSDLIFDGSPGSRIIITTRNKVVAEITDALQIYELKGLSEMESWDLFQKVAFKHGKLLNEGFGELGKEIAAKCCGLPLAIRTIGSMLYTKSKESEWKYFKDEELSKLDPKINVVETLKLSYNHLPSNLKQCFAFCSIFPKDYVFDVSTLIKYWKAQGYIDFRHEGILLEDNGLNCLKYLVNRSFFQVEEENEDGEIVKCKMHDFMHDLATLVAGEEAKLWVYGSASGTTVTRKIRHMSLHEVSNEIGWQDVAPLLKGRKARKARTLIFQSGTNNGIAGEECLNKILDELKYLRVLVLPWGEFKELPGSIDKLKHLRHLDLSMNHQIEMLPDSITQLYNLRELNLDGCTTLKKLPRNIEKLVNLIYLGVDGCISLKEMPLGIGKLTSLEVLSQFNLSYGKRRNSTGGLDELDKLNKLKGKLRLGNLQRVKKGVWECEVANLKNKPHLRSLTLNWENPHEVKDMSSTEKSLEALQPHGNLRKLRLEHYGGVRFPKWLFSLQNLVQIQIIDCDNCMHLPSLDGLASLKHLEVDGLQGLEYIIDNNMNSKRAVTSCFFPSLETLIIRICPELKGWWSTSTIEKPLHYQLIRLSHLEIQDCPNIKGWMPQLPSLENLDLNGVSAGMLEESLKQAKPPSTSTGTSLSPPLQSLTILRIQDLGDLHQDALQNLASLKFLDIRYVTDTRVLSPWLHHLTSLERLSIYGFVQMNLFEENDTKLIQRLKNHLRTLEIKHCEKMKSLPQGIQYLTSLETLQIIDCKELESMPTWVSNLTSLNGLDIHECPKLRERCGSNQGDDWHSISHIPNIYVDLGYKWVQRDGVYQL